MKKIFGVTLGVLTALGGFMDMGDIVANAATGARFQMSLAWAVLVGVGGIVVYAEMAGRIATVSDRPVFDLVRERLGFRVGLANLLASLFITLLTLVAEVAGVALALQLATDVNYLLWVPLVAFVVWIVIWRVKFDTMETSSASPASACWPSPSGSGRPSPTGATWSGPPPRRPCPRARGTRRTSTTPSPSSGRR